MLLAIDIGNTQTVIGLFDGERLLSSWRMVTPRYETSDEIASSILGFLSNSGYSSKKINSVSVSCVVPRMVEEIKKMSKRYFNLSPFMVKNGIRTDLGVLYDYPEEIGADRIANSVAAKEIYGAPAVIVDFGTATTFDVISTKAQYIGGIIAPGIEISSEALFTYAAKLTKVDISWPPKVIGKNTYDGIRSGILYGFLGQADFIIDKIVEEESKIDKAFKPKVIATGGLAFLMVDKSRWIEIFDPDLTLKGLRILINKNKKESM